MKAWVILAGAAAAVLLFLLFALLSFSVIKAAWEYAIEQLF